MNHQSLSAECEGHLPILLGSVPLKSVGCNDRFESKSTKPIASVFRTYTANHPVHTTAASASARLDSEID